MMLQSIAAFSLLLSILELFTHAFPYPATHSPSFVNYSPYLQRRTYPVFPDTPPSCPICAQNYASINSCAQAAPVLANFTMIIFNPGAFISVIKCACTDTFQSVFPQCVDCFVATNQSDILNTPDLPSVVDGMRKVCALSSSLLGGVATADGEVTPTTSIAPPAPTGSSDALSIRSGSISMGGVFILLLTIMSVSNLGLEAAGLWIAV